MPNVACIIRIVALPSSTKKQRGHSTQDTNPLQ
jgi:hypothetical protein